MKQFLSSFFLYLSLLIQPKQVSMNIKLDQRVFSDQSDSKYRYKRKKVRR